MSRWLSIVLAPLCMAILMVAAAAAMGVIDAGRIFHGRLAAPSECPPPPSVRHEELPATVMDGLHVPGLKKVLGNPATSGLSSWPRLFDAPPKAYDIDGDGHDELIVQGNETLVYVFNPDTGRVLAQLPTCRPYGWYVERVLNSAEAAHLRPGEPTSLVIASHAAYITVWQFVPQTSNAQHFTFEKKWERRMADCFDNPGMDASPTLVDLDGDGTLEILAMPEELGLFALSAGGDVLWKQCWAGGNSTPLADDLDGDGLPEAIFASDNGLITVLDGKTGGFVWNFNAASPQYGITPGSISVTPAVAELDGVAPKEVVFTARYAPAGNPAEFPNYHFAIFAVHGDKQYRTSQLVWMRQPQWGHPLSYTQLVILDVDGDNRSDIFGMDWNTIGHYPGNWDVLGNYTHVFRLDEHGEDVWVRDVESWWSNKNIAVRNDANGNPEVWVNGIKDGSDGFWRLSAATGDASGFLYLRPWTVERGVTFLDLHHDGNVQVAFPATIEGTQPRLGALLLFDLSSIDQHLWRPQP